MKKILALVLCAAMVLGLLPGVYAVEEPVTKTETTVSAVEDPTLTRVDQAVGTKRPAPAYEPEEVVTVMVLLDAPAVLADYTPGYVERAGAAVADFLAQPEAAARRDALRGEQAALTAKITTLAPSCKVVAQWTNLVNAMAVEIPYGKLADVSAIPGVKTAYVQKVYDRPVEEKGTLSDLGTFGYSYDMVNLNPVWEAGITGAGMLVAVLDTGLDITFTSWGDTTDLQNGVRRVHQAFTDDSFMTEAGVANVRYTSDSLAAFLEEHQLIATTGAEGNKIVWDNNALYKTLKVPFACDYADGDINVQPASSDHGTHVSGTIAGFARTAEGAILFSGLAPDAQIMAMKVFPNETGGAQEYAIVNALEDAATLGADVINLSLGSDNGFASDDTLAGVIYAQLSNAGILFMTSAGNSGTSSAGNHYGDYNLTSDPENSMMSAPAIYPGHMAVASMENAVTSKSMLTWTAPDGTATRAAYLDPTGVAMKYQFAGADPVNIIPVDGYGTYNDYYNAGFRSYYGYGDMGQTGIALVKRGGGISFVDKINMATQFTWSYYDPAKGYYVTVSPVKAVLVYDEDPAATQLLYMSTDGSMLTSAFLSGKDGAALYEAAKAAIAAGSHVTLTVDAQDEVAPSPDSGKMSVFSSWGAGNALELKPEITAPGGNIWSTIIDQTYTPADPSGKYDDYTGSYGMMSGTSMASPHMTGITALVEQYIRTKLGVTDTNEVAALAAQLLVSTAVPQMQTDTAYYSPRQQGAGLVNVAGAISTPVYATVEGQDVGKVELLDDPDFVGKFPMAFTLHNLTGEAATYTAKLVVQVPETAATETKYGEKTVMLETDRVLFTRDLGTVTVPASGAYTVDTAIDLTGAQVAELKELFPNGTYIEGYVLLTAEAAPGLTVPFMGFLGDWTAAPIFDSATWLDEVAEGQTMMDLETQWGVTILGYFDGFSFYNLGQNVFDSTSAETQTVYHEENITLSPKGLFRMVNDFELYQKRDAKAIVVEVFDAETGELYYRDYAPYLTKSLYNSTYGVAIPNSLYYFTETNWAGTDLNGDVLPSGTQCIMTITAYGAGEYPTFHVDEYDCDLTDFETIVPGEKEPTFNGHPMDKTGDVISFLIRVDSAAPRLVNSAVSVAVDEADGKTYMTGSFVDDGSIASVEVYPQVKRTYAPGYGDPSYVEYGMDTENPFFSAMIFDAAVQEYSFKADVSSYAHTVESYPGENYYYNYEWTGNVYIFGGDYGGNDRGYMAFVNTDSGLLLSTTSALLHVGSEFDLNVINNTGSDAPLTRTSTHPEVATIDEFGHIVALAPGQTEMVITNGTHTAVCVVAVVEYPTEVVDFDLSIDHFDGLKPDGSIVVNVTNLRPSDVVLKDVSWLVYEDDAQWAGLLNVAQEDKTGLSGRITLNAAYGDVEKSGGSGHLDVTLNGVTRTMTFSWDDLYADTTADGLIGDAYYNEQTVYVTQGQTATLIAKYRQNHSFIPVELYTLQGYEPYGYSNPTTAAVGLTLDGPTFATNGGYWEGKLVAEPGYKLPEYIKVLTRYDYGYESEMYLNAYYGGYTYDPTTGVITVANAPSGSTNTLVIRADGVEDPGNPGGTSSGTVYTRPEATWGPFDWTYTDGTETDERLTTAEGVNINYTEKNVAYFTPDVPGVTQITAASKDGQYAVNFAVVCLPVQAEELTLDTHHLRLLHGQEADLTATLSPEPTLAKDGEILWTSFNPEVAQVDEEGHITALTPGYAYIQAALAADVSVSSYCVVEVVCPSAHLTDVPENVWYHGAVDFVMDNGLMKGMSATEFGPNVNLTRGMVVTVLYRQAGSPAVEHPATFPDVVPGTYYADAVAWAENVGIVTGYPDGTFCPGNPVKRAEMVTMLYRYADLVDGADMRWEDPSILGAFPDGEEVPAYALLPIGWAVENGILYGELVNGKAMLNAQGLATRAQFAAILCRWLTK